MLTVLQEQYCIVKSLTAQLSIPTFFVIQQKKICIVMLKNKTQPKSTDQKQTKRKRRSREKLEGTKTVSGGGGGGGEEPTQQDEVNIVMSYSHPFNTIYNLWKQRDLENKNTFTSIIFGKLWLSCC